MDIMNELDFALRVPLRNKQRHAKGFVYSCPFCNDHKTRAYLLMSSDKVVAYCHNCSVSTSLKKLLEYADPCLHEEYVAKAKDEYREKLLMGEIGKKKHEIRPTINSITDKEHNLKLYKLTPKWFHPAKDNKDCVAYAIKRKFPEHIIETLLFNNHPSMPWSNMLIFPFRKDEYVYGFQGRRMTEKRFYNYSKNESFKIYNIFGVDLTKDVFIFESIIDSWYKSNSVSMCGSDLSEQVQGMIKHKVWVFDFDKTGILKAMKYANMGERIYIPPPDLRKYKDFNKMVCEGVDPAYLEQAVVGNIFGGPSQSEKWSAMSKLKFIKSTRKL